MNVLLNLLWTKNTGCWRQGCWKIILGHNNCNNILYNNYFQNVIKYNTLLTFHNKEKIRRHELGTNYFQFGGLFSQTNKYFVYQNRKKMLPMHLECQSFLMINEQFSDVNLINKLIWLVFQTIFFIDTIIAIFVSTKFRITKDCFISIAMQSLTPLVDGHSKNSEQFSSYKFIPSHSVQFTEHNK